MQIFDFSDGVQGKHLAHVRMAHHIGGWLVEKNEVTYRVEIANPRQPKGHEEKWAWACWAEDLEGNQFKPEDFGVDAICFCYGEYFYQWHAGHPDAKSAWEWVVIGTKDWNRKACHQGILKATRHG